MMTRERDPNWGTTGQNTRDTRYWEEPLNDARERRSRERIPEELRGWKLECWKCERKGLNPPRREVVGYGPVVNRADPTQTYRLTCGHVTI